MDENTYSIVLRDSDNDNLVFIAEVVTQGDIKRIKEISKELCVEYYNGEPERDDFYEELQNRTGLNIYRATVLDI